MTEPFRVLHIVAPARYGGLERVVEMLVTGQRRAGHDARVLAILDAGHIDHHPFVDTLRGADVPVEVIATPPRAYRSERRAVASSCALFRPQVVHLHGGRPDVVDAGVPLRLKIPAVSTVHGFTGGGGWKGRLYEWLQVRAFRRLGAVIVVSTPLVERLTRAGVSPRRIHLLRNAWSDPGEGARLGRSAARAALGIPDDAIRIGWVGRVSSEKGPDVMVAALARLKEPGVTLSMVGTGRDVPGVRAAAAGAGVGDRISWHGEVRDAGRLLKAFDLLVLSSRTEGTPIVLLEAIGAGVPVVATAVGGVPDVVSEKEAILVPSEDPAALAAAVLRVLADPAAARARAVRARERLAQEFGAEPWVEHHLALYRSLAMGSGG